MSAIKIDIPRRARSCTAGKEEFLPGMNYFSLLTPQPGETSYQRQDFCHRCWEKTSPQKEGNIYWQSTLAPKTESSDRSERSLHLLDRLRALQETADASSLATAFLLALLLVREKILHRKQEISSSAGCFLLYEVVDSGEILTVQKVSLSLTEVQKIEQEIRSWMNI